MTSSPLTRLCALLLVVTTFVPVVFFSHADQAHAVVVEVISDTSATSIKTSIESTITAVKSTLSAALDVTNTAANVAKQIKSYVLDPIAFIVSGNLLKAITSGILDFVNKNHLYVQNLQGYMQNVGDVQANSFLNSFSRNSNSPFAGAITSSLRANYLQQTSMTGFFAANRNTLNQSSPNINSFLSGNWSAGGARAWFALTTQDQNNPYTLYYRAQDQLTRSVTDATSAKLAQLNWGQGFLSWCGTQNTTQTDFGGGCDDAAKVDGKCPVQAGDSCTKSDGTEGKIQTPGSVIKDFLSKALGSDIDKLTGVGDISAQISGIMGNIGTIMQTVNMAAGLFGADGGLASVSGVGASRSPFANYLNSSTYLGTTVQNVNANANTSGVSSADFSNRVGQYEAAWNTISGTANAVSATLTDLVNSCPVVSNQAKSALTTTVNPVLAQAAQAAADVVSARTQLAHVQSEGSAGDPAYTGDLAALATMAPTTTNVAEAQQQATSLGSATWSENNPLVVNASTFFDQMTQLDVNAKRLRTAQNCPPPTE